MVPESGYLHPMELNTDLLKFLAILTHNKVSKNKLNASMANTYLITLFHCTIFVLNEMSLSPPHYTKFRRLIPDVSFPLIFIGKFMGPLGPWAHGPHGAHGFPWHPVGPMGPNVAISKLWKNLFQKKYTNNGGAL